MTPSPLSKRQGARAFGYRWVVRRGALILLTWFILSQHAAGGWVQPFLQSLDWWIYDQRLSWLMPHTLDDRVVIVDVDERSVAEVGQWPWARDQVADLVRELTERQQAASVGLDTVFVEADGRSPASYLGRLAQMDAQLHPGGTAEIASALQRWLDRVAVEHDFDRQLAQVLKQAPVSLGYYLSSDRNGARSGALPLPLMRPDQMPAGMLYWDGYGANLPLLTEAAPAAGFLNAVTDTDGVVRRVPLLAEFDGALYSSLALSSLRLGLGQPPLHVQTTPGGKLAGFLLFSPKPLNVPLDAQGTVFVPFRGAGGPHGSSFRYISAADVLLKRLPPGELKGRFVLLGFSTPGLMDLRTTPAGQAFPGVEVHANLISGILDGRTAIRPDYAVGYEILRLSVLAILLIVITVRSKSGVVVALGLFLLVLIWVMDWALHCWAGLVLPTASALVLVIFGVGIHVTLGYLLESRVRRRLARQFATYVPPALVQQMLREPDHYSMQARTETLTVMFCDLRDFTTMAEDMDPVALQILLSDILSRLTHCIHEGQGTVDKYIGDCVMAFWGAPVVQPNHAALAFASAQNMLTSLRQFNAERMASGLSTVAAGISLNTGPMSVGNMGSDLRRAYTVIGDAVNLGARLEGLTRTYQVDMIVSQSTKEEIADLALWQELDIVRVKGRAEMVRIYTPRGSAQEDDAAVRDELQRWHRALDCWRKGDLEAFGAQITCLQTSYPSVYLYRLYAERLRKRLDWMGQEGSTPSGTLVDK